MNVRRAIDIVMRRLGNRSASGLRVAVLDEMAIAQEQLEQAPELPFWLEVEQASAFTEPGEARLPLPTDFLREKEDFNLQILIDGNWRDLKRRNYDEIDLYADRNTLPGIPEFYYMRNRYIVFRPAPDAEYQVLFPTYFGKQVTPIDDISSENAWFVHVPDLLMSMSGVQVAAMVLKDEALAAKFAVDQKSAEDRMVRLITAKEEENRTRRMG